MTPKLLAVASGALELLILTSPTTAQSDSVKRGLVHIPNSQWPEDNAIWYREGSSITWYYNYGQSPSPQFDGISQDQLEFVPQKWGQSSDPTDTSFSNYVEQLIAEGRGIKNVLAYNEPEYGFDSGGAQLDPATAAKGWIADFVPLQEKGVRVGLPAVNGDDFGLNWLSQFMQRCSEQLNGRECPYDFLPVHWYNDFPGLTNLISKIDSMFPGSKIWLTEFTEPHVDLVTTQEFFKQSIPWLDGSSLVERYSWFGAFRSSVSNVGVNATFLNNAGQLTDIGSWYLGGEATGIPPTSG
ncbi:glycoside hydrolase family 128 protein [Xylariaceae sp. FL1272]|nr:glycoside hydrolase family 128 protein [Xylariaceae sp. FL1272]